MKLDSNLVYEKEKFKEKFNLLFNQLWLAKMQYDVCNKKYDFRKIVPYAEILIVSEDALITSIIIKLAKIFDVDKRGDSITISYVLNAIKSCKSLNMGRNDILTYVDEQKKKLESDEILNVLKEIRDKYHAHLDKRYMNEEMIEIQIKERELLSKLKKIIYETIEILKNLFKEVFEQNINTEEFEKKMAKQEEHIITKMFK